MVENLPRVLVLLSQRSETKHHPREWRTIKRKEEKMIKNVRSAYKGVLNCDITDLKYNICQYLRDQILSADFPMDSEPSCPMDFADIMQKIFGHRHIALNTKNVEYQEEFMLSDFGLDADLEKRLSKFKFADMLITMTIYRLGSYSYFNAEVDYMRTDHRYTIG